MNIESEATVPLGPSASERSIHALMRHGYKVSGVQAESHSHW